MFSDKNKSAKLIALFILIALYLFWMLYWFVGTFFGVDLSIGNNETMANVQLVLILITAGFSYHYFRRDKLLIAILIALTPILLIG